MGGYHVKHIQRISVSKAQASEDPLLLASLLSLIVQLIGVLNSLNELLKGIGPEEPVV
jgi:hypothetical protein